MAHSVEYRELEGGARERRGLWVICPFAGGSLASSSVHSRKSSLRGVANPFFLGCRLREGRDRCSREGLARGRFAVGALGDACVQCGATRWPKTTESADSLFSDSPWENHVSNTGRAAPTVPHVTFLSGCGPFPLKTFAAFVFNAVCCRFNETLRPSPRSTPPASCRGGATRSAGQSPRRSSRPRRSCAAIPLVIDRSTAQTLRRPQNTTAPTT